MKRRQHINLCDTLVIAGSGPSLHAGDLALAVEHFPVMVTNRTYIMLANVCRESAFTHYVYGCDYGFWEEEYEEVLNSYRDLPQLWTSSWRASVEFRKLKYVNRKHDANNFNAVFENEALCSDPGRIYTGHNSGYQCINLAYHLGYTRVLLLGFDSQHTGGNIHHHDDYKLNNPDVFMCDTWRKVFDKLGDEMKNNRDFEIINCSRETAISTIPRKPLKECLR